LAFYGFTGSQDFHFSEYSFKFVDACGRLLSVFAAPIAVEYSRANAPQYMNVWIENDSS
jgi:hypothetical protein